MTSQHSVLTFVNYHHDAGVAYIALNRPDRLNAISPALATDLLVALDTARADGARLIVLSGEGRAFCSGHDLKEPDPAPGSEESETHLRTLQTITRRLIDPNLTSVAIIHGYTLGAGAELALACDVILAGHSTHIAFPEVSVGLSVTGGGSFLLPATVGIVRAKQLMMLGESLDAQRALEWGLVTQIVADDHLSEARLSLVERIHALPQESLAMAKKGLQESHTLGIEKTMDLEVSQARSTLTSPALRSTREKFWGERES